MGGTTSHWTSKGSSEIYSPSSTGFRIYLYYSGLTPAVANQRQYQINWMGEDQSGSTTDGVCSGQSGTSWNQYSSNGVYIDINTASCGFTSTPDYTASMIGTSSHWSSTGSSEIYSATATSFRVYINQAGITTSNAQAWGWRVNWIGSRLTQKSSDGACSGHTASKNTNWVQYSSNGIYLDVDTSACGFSATPSYTTSLGGTSSHWTTTGSTEIYSATPTGFRVYIYSSGLSTSFANQYGWQMNWLGQEKKTCMMQILLLCSSDLFN